MNLMGSLPMVGGSFPVVNTMSVPICQVSVFFMSDPSIAYDNERNMKVLLGPGEEGQVSYPVRKDDAGTPVDPAGEKFGMRVYGCKEEAYSQKVGGVLVTIEDVDVHSSSPVAIR